MYFYYVASHICVHMHARKCTYITIARLPLRMCLRWGQQNVTTSWWGTALLLTKGASGCESVPTGKPVAMVLALQHQCQDRKLTVALGEKVSESSEENAPEMRIRGAKSPSEEGRGNAIKNSCK